MNFYNKDINSIIKELNSNLNGLNENQVKLNLEKFGSNEPEKPKHTPFLLKLLYEFKNVMIIILIISAIISCSMAIIKNDKESLFEGLLIFVIVIINAIVGVIQEQKAENALALLAKQTMPLAKINRNGFVQNIEYKDIVVGDIVFLKSGDYVPADIRIIESQNLKCDESSLTGESHEILKNSNTILKKDIPISLQENMCFSGTIVKSGTATGIVVATGKNTEFGKIAKILNTSKKEKTPLEKNIDKIGKAITIGVVFIVAVVFLIQVFFNKNISVLDALLTAVALAVAAIPESLPAVITIIMALGVQKLAKQNAIVKKLSAVETLGCCNIICSDKTGTLTQNKMSVKHVFCSMKTFDEYNKKNADMSKLITIASVCNNIKYDKEGTPSGDATETAIIKFLEYNKIEHKNIKQEYEIISKIEFDSTKKLMSVCVKQDENQYTFVKGAIDYLIQKCKFVLIDGNEVELNDTLKQSILKSNDEVCKNGERVISFAIKNSTEDIDSALTFVGFVGIIDPPRKEVFSAIKNCKKAGLKTIMITGDHPTTAFAIAKELGIAKKQTEVITGFDIDKLSATELSKIISNYTVFARVSPQHKLVIVEALKKSGNIVAMNGDGVNDAPSVKNANIGLCMGKTGTDVTREVADIIISDDNFLTIVTAIKEGRTIYQNITKTILFLLSTNIVEVLGIFVTSLVLHDSIFLLPTQILFINLVTDSLPAFALGIEPPEKDIMQKQPRNANNSLLSGTVGSSILYQGFIQTLVVLIMFVIAKNKFGNATASTMSFMTICLMQIIHAINCKTEKSIFKINLLNNKFFTFSFLFLLGLILAVYFLPFTSTLFCLTKLNLSQWLYVSLTSLAIIPAVEIGKLFIK